MKWPIPGVPIGDGWGDGRYSSILRDRGRRVAPRGRGTSGAFVEAVRARLDACPTEAGLPLSGVYPGSGSLGETTAVLYEATADAFSTRFPGLTTNWAPDWDQIHGAHLLLDPLSDLPLQESQAVFD